MEELRTGDLVLAVHRSERRHTVGLTVERDGSLAVLAPTDIPAEQLLEIVRSREGWFWTKLAEKELLLRTWRPKDYVAGESHSYLGRHYRLALVDATGRSHPPLRLRGGFFELRRDQQDRAGEHFAAWYRARGREWLATRIQRHLTHFELPEAPLDVRDLGFRWGSCGDRGLHFHWRLMTLPPAIVDYVIVHELAHVRTGRHDRAFWSQVRRVMPDYERRREWLALNGAEA